MVSASIVDTTTISCQAPPGSWGFVPVEVSWNGKDFSTIGMQAQYVSATLETINPTNGPTLGGTPVTIYGQNFVEQTWACYIGRALGKLIFVSETAMVCTTAEVSAIGWAAVAIYRGNQPIGNRASFFIESLEVKGVAPLKVRK